MPLTRTGRRSRRGTKKSFPSFTSVELRLIVDKDSVANVAIRGDMDKKREKGHRIRGLS